MARIPQECVKKMEERKYRSVSLRAEFVEQIEDYIKEHPEYSTVTDFVNEAARIRLQSLKNSVLQEA
jgi:Arc/MetJ-type ribon-helix-helix transcriptional regulator